MCVSSGDSGVPAQPTHHPQSLTDLPLGCVSNKNEFIGERRFKKVYVDGVVGAAVVYLLHLVDRLLLLRRCLLVCSLITSHTFLSLFVTPSHTFSLTHSRCVRVVQVRRVCAAVGAQRARASLVAVQRQGLL